MICKWPDLVAYAATVTELDLLFILLSSKPLRYCKFETLRQF